MSIIIREATEKDDRSLIQLTKVCHMEGIISMRIDREPSYWGLINYRGGGKVIVAEKDHEIIGTISLHEQKLEFNSKQYSTLYIADFKVHPLFRNSSAAYRLMKYIHESDEYHRTDFTYVVVAEGNDLIEKVLSGKLGFPPFQRYATFNLYEFKPGKAKTKAKILGMLQTKTEIKNSYNKRLNSLNFSFPSLGNEHDADLSIPEKAELTISNTSFCKQNVIIKVPFTLFLPLWIFKQLSEFLPIARKPWLNESLEMEYISEFDFEDSSSGKQAFRSLIESQRDDLIKKKLHFISMALDERSELNEMVRSIPHYLFRSHLLACEGGKGSPKELFDKAGLVNFNYAKV